jgi:hypothetical protein
VERGFDFVCPGFDVGYLTAGAAKELAAVRGVEKDKAGTGY